MNIPSTSNVKLSITLDTLTARILKLSSDSQSGIEPTPFYSWWDPTDCQADPAVAPVTHEIPPDHEFQLFHFVMFCLSAPMIKQFLFHPCPDIFTSRIIMASSSRTVHTLHNAVFLNGCPWYIGCPGRNAQWLRESPETANSHGSVFHSTVRHAYDPPWQDLLAADHNSQKSLKHTEFTIAGLQQKNLNCHLNGQLCGIKIIYD